MKTVQGWTETVAYAECPKCKSMVTLGTGIVWDEKPMVVHCCVKFKVTPPDED